MRRELERIEIPDEHGARERAWAVVRDAYAQREPQPRAVPLLRPLIAFAVLAAVVAAALSPPGQAVVDSVRNAIGSDDAEQSLFSLPGPGRMLVSSDAGLWVVAADGSKRLLGDYRDGAWSPFGRFVAASRPSELVALEPDGDVRWKLARPNVRLPAWTGTETNTRIAYVTDSRLHVVGGDGSRDVEAGGASAPARVRPAWRPGERFELTYVGTDGFVRTFATETRGFSAAVRVRDARKLAWSPDGSRLVVVGRHRYVELTRRGSVSQASIRPLRGISDAAFGANGQLALTRTVNGRSDVLVDGRVRFSGTGTFADLAWAPAGRWVVVSWREADQWLFVRTSGPRRARAVANASRQFDSRTPPRILGWCCA